MEEYKSVCSNPWCRAPFNYTEKDMINGEKPKVCNKCKSFDNELSGGITWNEKKYEGNPFKGDSLEVKHKINYNK